MQISKLYHCDILSGLSIGGDFSIQLLHKVIRLDLFRLIINESLHVVCWVKFSEILRLACLDFFLTRVIRVKHKGGERFSDRVYSTIDKTFASFKWHKSSNKTNVSCNRLNNILGNFSLNYTL